MAKLNQNKIDKLFEQIDDSIEKIQEKQAEIKANSEDRENVPELDQTTGDGFTSFTIENEPPLTGAVEKFETPAKDYQETDDPVGDEIRKLQLRNQAPMRTAPALSAPTRQPTINDGDILEF